MRYRQKVLNALRLIHSENIVIMRCLMGSKEYADVVSETYENLWQLAMGGKVDWKSEKGDEKESE